MERGSTDCRRANPKSTGGSPLLGPNSATSPIRGLHVDNPCGIQRGSYGFTFRFAAVRSARSQQKAKNEGLAVAMHILRVLNTNVDGKQKIMFALTSIKGIGRRFANIVCKKADVDMNKRAGELSAAELENLMTVVANPRQFKIPDWFLNRKKDYKDGRYSQIVSNSLDMKLRDDLERLKKIRFATPGSPVPLIFCLRITYRNI
ncbi:hypothetical protein B296_00019280 [Ensete ventricosum]|uniref:40S ribosomal protein S18 n=1 Tax=Ensete ventricosum TaxID=4639 RepID=A0A426ZTW3_ENSVE|nr:hypothetical protein B296_00019280 [Ensete ventricosum]